MFNKIVMQLNRYAHQFSLSLVVASCAVGFSQNASAVTIDISALFSGTGEMEFSGGAIGVCGSATDYTPYASGSMTVGSEMSFCNADYRGAVEFDINSFDDSSTIGSATLSLTTESTHNTVGENIDVHGFAGNGTSNKSDFNVDNQISSFTPLASPLITYNIDVTDYVRSLVDGTESYAGFMLDSVSGIESNRRIVIFGIDSLNNPTLSVETVPIPAAAWLFGSALLGLGVIKRKKT